MNQSDDHNPGIERQFDRDEEMMFRIIARRNKLLGDWAARLMGLSEAEAEAYGGDLVRADFEGGGEKDVVLKLLGDLTGAGVDIDELRIREALKRKLVEARRQLIG
jgi:hypothetical protein